MTPRRIFPNVIGIGFGRSGSTFIAEVLRLHPEVCFSTRKETHFFSGLDYSRGLEFYSRYFQHFDPDKHKVVAEWDNGYILNENNALVRIRNTLGDGVRLLVCYRSPEDTFLSLIKYNKTIGKLDLKATPREVFEKKQQEYIDRLLYDKYLEYLFNHFPRDSVLVMKFEEMRDDPSTFFSRLYRFMGITETDVHSTCEVVNVSQPPLSRKLHKLLYLILKRRYGEKKAGAILRYHPKDKPKWLRIIQRLNTRGESLDAELKVELEEFFAPHMRDLDLLLNQGQQMD